MGDMTKNLSRYEFKCPCGCGEDTVDYTLVIILQGTVDHFEETTGRGLRIVITSGFRCKKHNATIKGAAPGSLHARGRAADFKLFFVDTGEQVKPEYAAKFIKRTFPKASIGYYHNRTHTDTRSGGRAEWHG